MLRIRKKEKTQHTDMSRALEKQEKRERLSVEDKDSERKQRLQDRRGDRRQETGGRSLLIAPLPSFHNVVIAPVCLM